MHAAVEYLANKDHELRILRRLLYLLTGEHAFEHREEFVNKVIQWATLLSDFKFESANKTAKCAKTDHLVVLIVGREATDDLVNGLAPVLTLHLHHVVDDVLKRRTIG